MPDTTIAFQGEPGAYSHLAARQYFPDMTALPCGTFDDAFEAVKTGRAIRAIIPVENSLAGRVSDVYHLLPESGLYIVAEHFLRVRHQLLGIKGATLADIKTVASHAMALGQCRGALRRLGLHAVNAGDTAGAARELAERGDKSQAVIASAMAAEIYGLDILKPDIEDEDHNTTRFLVMERALRVPPPDAGNTLISFIFQVRNVPAALYKALGGCATNGVNMLKLESYQLKGSFRATQFHADIEGHPDDPAVKRAMEELHYFSTQVAILGAYPADSFRQRSHMGEF